MLIDIRDAEQIYLQTVIKPHKITLSKHSEIETSWNVTDLVG
jgi:hypothetical protein